MNRKDRARKYERARAHQAKMREKKKEEPSVTKVASRPPGPRRKRSLPKKIVRAMGRKIRSRSEPDAIEVQING